MTRPALLRLLERVEAVDEPAARTLYLPPGSAYEPKEAAISDVLACAGESITGHVIFWSERARLVVMPPFPIESAAISSGLVTAPLRALLLEQRALAVILVRLGGYSVGLYRDGGFVLSKTGGRFVKNRHRKGGQSQRRFERIREGQIREHFDAIAEVVRSRLEPLAAEIDAVVLGGDRRTVQAMLKRAPLPPSLAAKVLPRIIDVPEPRREVLERSPAAIWTSRVLVVREPADTFAASAANSHPRQT